MAQVRQLDASYDAALAALWSAATEARRTALATDRAMGPAAAGPALSREGAFGVGIVDGAELLAAAVALPARDLDGRSTRLMPGLAHISTVATRPDAWRSGYGRQAVRAVMTAAQRRGYARAQLWTHATNEGARRLYEAIGFQRSGRAILDDNGEEILHFIRELPAEPVAPRPAARLLCCDSDDRVLLLSWRDPHDGYELWEPPGGGVEPGETPRDAALREWAEETGLEAPQVVADPVVVGRDLLWRGERYVGDETFFLGQVTAAGVPDPADQTSLEKACYLGHRWVPWQRLGDLAGADQPDVLTVLRLLAPDGPWREPGVD